MNVTMTILVVDSSLIVTRREVVPRGETESPVNPMSADVIGVRSPSVRSSFLMASIYNMMAELPMLIITLFTF
ncbi:unnamed protein product, partial [Musa textilis]